LQCNNAPVIGLLKGFRLVVQERDLNNGNSTMKAITLLGVVGLVGVVALSAAAQGTSESDRTVKEVECNKQADAQDFGIHEYKRHRFVIRCIADLPQLGS
jgi:hypothetical protein